MDTVKPKWTRICPGLYHDARSQIIVKRDGVDNYPGIYPGEPVMWNAFLRDGRHERFRTAREAKAWAVEHCG